MSATKESVEALSVVGRGFNTLTGKPKLNSILEPLKPSLVNAIGDSVDEVRIILSEDDLIKSLDLSANAQLPSSMTAINFGLSAIKNRSSNQFVILIHKKQEVQTLELLTDYTVRAEIIKKLKPNMNDTYQETNEEDFFEMYGNSIIYKQVLGKEFTVIIKCTVLESIDSTSLIAKANLGKIPVTFSAQFKKELHEKQISFEVQATSSGVKIDTSELSLEGLKPFQDIVKDIDAWRKKIVAAFNSYKGVSYTIRLEHLPYTDVLNDHYFIAKYSKIKKWWRLLATFCRK